MFQNNQNEEMAPEASSSTTTTNTIDNRMSPKKIILYGVFAFFFLLFPILFFVINPLQFPWFIFPCGLLLMILAIIKKFQSKENKVRGEIHFKIHKIVFITTNTLLILTNVWFHGYPWCAFVLFIWLPSFITHRNIVKEKNPGENNFWKHLFKGHIMTYIAITIISIISYLYLTCYQEGCNRFQVQILFFAIPLTLWGGLLALHITYHKKLLCFKKKENLVILPINTTSVSNPEYDQQIDLEDGSVINK